MVFLRKTPESSAARALALMENSGDFGQFFQLENRLLGGFNHTLTFISTALRAGTVRGNCGTAVLAKSSLNAFITVRSFAAADLHLGSFSLRNCHFLFSLLTGKVLFQPARTYLKLNFL